MSKPYFPDTKALAVFSVDGPQPQMLINTPNFKVVVVGLLAGQKLPLHADGPAMYHFLEGGGSMFVGEESFAISPGVTVAVPSGVKRGMSATTNLTFIGSKGAL